MQPAGRQPAADLDGADATRPRIRDEATADHLAARGRIPVREHHPVVERQADRGIAVDRQVQAAVAGCDDVLHTAVHIGTGTPRWRYRGPGRPDRRPGRRDGQVGTGQLGQQVLPQAQSGVRVAGEGDDPPVHRIHPQMAGGTVGVAVVPDPAGTVLGLEQRQAEPPPVGQTEGLGPRHRFPHLSCVDRREQIGPARVEVQQAEPEEVGGAQRERTGRRLHGRKCLADRADPSGGQVRRMPGGDRTAGRAQSRPDDRGGLDGQRSQQDRADGLPPVHPGDRLDQVAGQDEAEVGVREAGTGRLHEMPRAAVVQQVPARRRRRHLFGVGAGGQPGGVAQHLAKGELIAHVGQLGQVVAERAVEVEIAVRNQDHRGRGGTDLGDGADGNRGVRGHPPSRTVFRFAELDGDRVAVVVDGELRSGYPVLAGERREPSADE